MLFAHVPSALFLLLAVIWDPLWILLAAVSVFLFMERKRTRGSWLTKPKPKRFGIF